MDGSLLQHFWHLVYFNTNPTQLFRISYIIIIKLTTSNKTYNLKALFEQIYRKLKIIHKWFYIGNYMNYPTIIQENCKDLTHFRKGYLQTTPVIQPLVHTAAGSTGIIYQRGTAANSNNSVIRNFTKLLLPLSFLF